MVSDPMRSPFLVVDTESNGKDFRHDKDAIIRGTALAWLDGASVHTEFHEHLDPIKRLLLEHPRRVFHNAKYDLVALAKSGVDLISLPFYDTMLMGHWLNENMPSKALDYMSRAHGGEPKNKPKIMKDLIKKRGWDHVPIEMLEPYAENDAFITYNLIRKLYPAFVDEGYDDGLWDVEQDFVRLIIKMESFGFRIDRDLCLYEISRGEQRMHEITEQLIGINIGSRDDLEILFIDILELQPYKRSGKTGKLSFDAESMAHYEEQLALTNHPAAKLVLEYRGWQKAISSYYKAYITLVSEDGNVHPNMLLHGTRTGRLSCAKPNFQQLPRVSDKPWNGRTKDAIIARDGYDLWEFDYSNLELRISAIYCKEPNLIGPLQKGFKPFDVMAEQLGWERQDCKTFTYATSYGAGVRKIANTFGISQDASRRMREEYFGMYPRLRSTSNRATKNAESRGYSLLWSGRRRHWPKGYEAHKAFNSIIQGGAAELVKRVMLTIDRMIDWDDCRMLLQVHDSLVFEIRKGTEDYWHGIIRAVMENTGAVHPQLGQVPFPVDCKKWGST